MIGRDNFNELTIIQMQVQVTLDMHLQFLWNMTILNIKKVKKFY